MGNFDYISEFSDLQTLYIACTKAETTQTEAPKEAAASCKSAIEFLCRFIASKNGLKCNENMDLSAMLDTEEIAAALSDMDIYKQIRQVRKRCNMAINLNEDLEGMPYVVELLFHIVGATLVSFDYIKKIPDYIAEVDHWI